MPNYNEAQGVADLLSKFDFNIISEGPGDFSTQHRKYTCEFSKPGIESFTTTYQSNPRFGGHPTATDVFAALASDALAVDGRHIDDFADEMGFEKPSIDFNDNNMDIEDFASEAQNAIYDAMDEPLYDALGSNDEILEDGELSGDFEAIKESGYDFPNPCAMSAEAVRTVNEKGYETAFNEFWKEFMPDKGYEVPTVSEAAQESREASGKLEQDSHDGQTPEREDERADGDAEH